MPKCLECGHEEPDLRRHLKAHKLNINSYQVKHPNSLVIDPAIHEALRVRWRAVAEKKNLKKMERIAQGKSSQKELKDTQNPVFTGKYLEYYKRIKEQYTQEYKFNEGPELEELLFFLVANRQLQDVYDTKINSETFGADKEKNLLTHIRANNDRIQSLLSTLVEFKESREKTKDVINLHNETLKKAEDYIKKNYGEFAIRCVSCGQMLDTYGFPHPFFEGGETYSVFSTELWFLVVTNKIPIEYAAFILHSSIEGLLNTAKMREDKIPEVDLRVSEEKLKELQCAKN